MKKCLIILFLLMVFTNCVFGQINTEFESRKNIFSSEGFGFKYNLEEYESKSLFLKNHGVPIKTIEKTVTNRHNGLEDKIYELEYIDFIVTFYEWNKNAEGEFPESMLLSINSKENVEYIFGIKHGMRKKDLIKIFGEMDSRNNTIQIVSNNGNIVRIYLEKNIIKNIMWNYSLE